jgi:hypothetical protein
LQQDHLIVDQVARRGTDQRFQWAVLQKGTLVVATAVGLLTLAALGTVLLLFASRRATLRQVNASLLEISEQLRQLRDVAGFASL